MGRSCGDVPGRHVLGVRGRPGLPGAGPVVRRWVAVLAALGAALALGAGPAAAGITATPEQPSGAVGEPVPGPSDAGPGWSGAVVSIARAYAGTPYVWGGSTPAGFDCSGYTEYVFAQVGIDLPRTADAQRMAGYAVPAEEARPGDLVWEPGHIGIYTGDGMHIAARNPDTPLYEGPIFMEDPTYVRLGP